MKDAVQKVAVAPKAITAKLNAIGILAIFLGAMIFITPHANASNHLCPRAMDRCNTQKRISRGECQNIAIRYVCNPEAQGNRSDARDGYEYLKRRTR